MPRRPLPADLRAEPGHRAARPARHRPAHPRRDADQVAHRRLPERPAPHRRPAQPARLQGRHRQPGRQLRPGDEQADLGRRRPGRARLGHRRQLPGHPDHPDAGRVLGPGLAHRAGEDVRPAQGHRRPARRRTGDRRPQLRQGPARQRHPAGRPHPPGQPAHRGDGRLAHPAPRLQLRPGRGQRRQPRHGPGLLLLPAGRQAPVRGRADPADRRAPGGLHLADRRRLLLRPAGSARQGGLAGPGHVLRLTRHHPAASYRSAPSRPPHTAPLVRGSGFSLFLAHSCPRLFPVHGKGLPPPLLHISCKYGRMAQGCDARPHHPYDVRNDLPDDGRPWFRSAPPRTGRRQAVGLATRPRFDDAPGVDQGRLHGRLRARTARHRLGHAGRHHRAAALQRRHHRCRKTGGLRHRHRGDRLHAGHAARLRRRPHRGDRQHHPQADGLRAAPALGRLLVLPRPLQHRLRPRPAAVARHEGPGRTGARRQLASAPGHQPHRHDRLRRLPLPDRRDQPRHPGRHLEGVPPDAHRPLRRGRPGGPARQPGLHEPPAGPGHRLDQQAVADVPAGAAVRARLRHGDGDRAARPRRLRRGLGPALVRHPHPAGAVRGRHGAAGHHRRLVHELRLRLGVLQAGPQGLLQPHHHRSVRRRRPHHRLRRTAWAARRQAGPARLLLGLDRRPRPQHGRLRHRRPVLRHLGAGAAGVEGGPDRGAVERGPRRRVRRLIPARRG
ncbi:hypothetical protein SGPA1_40533 [Streptomyces misionensis JCM 4497]